jgi:hypothetical protein
MPLVNKEMETLEKMVIIRPSCSSWASLILVVAKRNHEGEITGIRMCIDCRKLKPVTVKDAFHFPRMDDILDALPGISVFSGADLANGYHNAQVDESSITKASSVTPFGRW